MRKYQAYAKLALPLTKLIPAIKNRILEKLAEALIITNIRLEDTKNIFFIENSNEKNG